MLLFSKRQSRVPPQTLWHYFKCYCDSLAKLIESLLTSAYNRSSGIQLLFTLYDHCIARWAELLSLPSTQKHSHHLELYFRHLLLLAINKAAFYLRLGLPRTSALIVDSAAVIYSAVQGSANTRTQSVCGRYMAAAANVWVECAMAGEGVRCYVAALRHFGREMSGVGRKYTNLQLIAKRTKELHDVQRNVLSYCKE